MRESSVLIVSYNTRVRTLACIHSVSTQSAGVDVEIIVIDNASRDGSADAIATSHPGVTLIRSSENLGFARAVNLGLQRATGRTIFLLNPDAIIESGTLRKLIDVLESEPRLGAVGPMVVSESGDPDPHCASAEITLARRLAWHFRLPKMGARLHLGATCGQHGARETEGLSGAALALRRTTLDEIGPMDERFFLYFEDADWVLRIRRAGYRIACVTEARVVHAQGSASKADPVSRSRHALSSELAFFLKHQGAVETLLLRIGIAANAVLRALTLDALRALRREERYRLLADLETFRRCVTP
jgi:N-acetylglucosaminyl-diphospho-decaprenol L-rhamnosyltransferase